MSNNFNKDYDDDDNYIDISVSTIFVNHIVFIASLIFAVIFYLQIDHTNMYLGNEFMVLFCIICAIYNLSKIGKNIYINRKAKQVIRIDYQYSNRM